MDLEQQPTNDVPPIATDPDQRAPGVTLPNLMANHARMYAKNGWRIYPVVGIRDCETCAKKWESCKCDPRPAFHCACGKPECKNEGKHPLFKDFKNKASSDPGVVGRWWEGEFAGFNIGMVPKGVLILDIDPDKGGDASIAELQEKYGALPNAPCQRSGSGGHHHWFKADPRITKNVTPLAPGVEFLGDGQNVVLAPSVHKSGNKYAWENGPNPLTHSKAEVLAALGSAPEWLFTLAEGKRPTVKRGRKPKEQVPIDTSWRFPREFFIEEAVAPIVAEGASRHVRGFWLAQQLHWEGYSPDEALEIGPQWVERAVAASANHDAYPFSDFERCVHDVAKANAPGTPRLKRWGDFYLRLSPDGYNPATDGIYIGEKRVSTFVYVAATGFDGKDQSFRLVQLIDQRGNYREEILDASDFAEGTFYEKLLRAGATILQKTAMCQYLLESMPSEHFETTAEIGWRPNGGPFLLPDASFGETPSDARVIFRGASGHRFNVAGTFDEWSEKVAAPCVGNSRLLLALSASLAAPVLNLIGASGIGFNFRGITSLGKSTALKVAGSLWGGGGGQSSGGFLRSWNLTLNGLEALAALHNHSLLALDELQQADEKVVGRFAYTLGNGNGRERMRSDLTRREASTWTIVTLSSGEKSPAQLAAKHGEDPKGGAELRLLDISADAGAGFGMFETLHGAERGKVFADTISKDATTFYGAAARRWLTWLAEHREEAAERVQAASAAWLAEHRPEGASEEVERACGMFATVAAAGELAAAAGIVPWPAGEAAMGVARCFEGWLATRGGVGRFDDQTGIAAVRFFLEQYGVSRFQAEMQGFDGRGPQIRAGYRKPGEFWILPEVFCREICKGQDATSVAKALREAGYLVTGDGKHLQRQLKREGDKSRCYVISEGILARVDDSGPEVRSRETEGEGEGEDARF